MSRLVGSSGCTTWSLTTSGLERAKATTSTATGRCRAAEPPEIDEGSRDRPPPGGGRGASAGSPTGSSSSPGWPCTPAKGRSPERHRVREQGSADAAFFVAWLRTSSPSTRPGSDPDLAAEGLDLDEAERFWRTLLAIPASQFRKPYREVADPSIRRSKHPMGCPSVETRRPRFRRSWACARLLTSRLPFRGSSAGRARTVKPVVAGSSPTPGALLTAPPLRVAPSTRPGKP